MATSPLNSEARAENIKALMLAAGVNSSTASRKLDRTLLITVSAADDAAVSLASEIESLASRTVQVVRDHKSATTPIAAELVLGLAPKVTHAPVVFAHVSSSGVCASRQHQVFEPCAAVHGLLQLLAACMITGVALRTVLDVDVPNVPNGDMQFDYGVFVAAELDLASPFKMGEAYLAGAGAIGNGFLWAARTVDLHGILHIVDDDTVSKGNLQRQIWFSEDDVGQPKAQSLAALAAGFLPNCTLAPAKCRLQAHPNRTDGAWLGRLFVAVDSRRARRELQNELPGEVFDASTTGVQEVVLHYNKQPNSGACLGCIYARDGGEVRHEEAVAEHLGISPEEMASERIDSQVASRIHARHPHLDPSALVGVPFDTLYKQLCGSGQLGTPTLREVIAPFAFISVLAGTLLLLEFIRRERGETIAHDWRVNPWARPLPDLRRNRSRSPSCPCCGRPAIRSLAERLWG